MRPSDAIRPGHPRHAAITPNANASRATVRSGLQLPPGNRHSQAISSSCEKREFAAIDKDDVSCGDAALSAGRKGLSPPEEYFVPIRERPSGTKERGFALVPSSDVIQNKHRDSSISPAGTQLGIDVACRSDELRRGRRRFCIGREGARCDLGASIQTTRGQSSVSQLEGVDVRGELAGVSCRASRSSTTMKPLLSPDQPRDNVPRDDHACSFGE